MPNRLGFRASLAAFALVVGCTSSTPSSTAPSSTERKPRSTAIPVGTFELTVSAVASGDAAAKVRALAFTPVPDARDGNVGSNPAATLEVWSDPFLAEASGSGCGGEAAIHALVRVQSAFTEELRNLHAEVTTVPFDHRGCDPAAPAGSPVNIGVNSLGAFDYGGDLHGSLSATGASLGSELDHEWWFLHPDATPFLMRARFWAEPYPPAPVAQATAHLEAGSNLEWFTDASADAIGLSGLIDVARDAGFTDLAVSGGSVPATSPTPDVDAVDRRILLAGDAPSAFAGTGGTDNLAPVSLGAQFTSDSPGVIRGIYYYRGPDETTDPSGITTVWLYRSDASPTLVGQGEDLSVEPGWHFVTISNGGLPIEIAASTQYVAARYVYGDGTLQGGGFPTEEGGFSAALDRWPLHIPEFGGVFNYDLAANGLPAAPSYTAGANYFVDVDFEPMAAFTSDPSLTSGQTYYWRVRNRFTGSDGLTTVNGSLVTSGGSFLVEPAPSALGFATATGDLQFTVGPNVTSVVIEYCTDADAPTALLCVIPHPPDTVTVTPGAANTHASGLGTGSYFWRITQQYASGRGTPSSWMPFTVP